MFDKWYAIIVVAAVLGIVALYGMDVYRESVAMANHCTQTVEQGLTVWKCDKP